MLSSVSWSEKWQAGQVREQLTQTSEKAAA